jgi:hypothetical protein
MMLQHGQLAVVYHEHVLHRRQGGESRTKPVSRNAEAAIQPSGSSLKRLRRQRVASAKMTCKQVPGIHNRRLAAESSDNTIVDILMSDGE